MLNGRLRSLAADTFTYGVSKAVPAAAMSLGVVLFVRTVGEAEYGRYSLLVAAAAVASSIGAGWINQGQLRFYSRYAARRTPYRAAVRRAWAGATALMGVVFAVGAALAHVGLISSLSAPSLLAGGAFAAALAFHTVRVSTFQAALQPQRVAWVEAIRAGAFLAFPLLLLAYVGSDHLVLVVGVALSYLVGGLFIRGERTPAPSDGGGGGAAEIARELWAYGWPLSLWLACSMGFQVSDRFLIQHVLSFEEVGLYASAYDLIVRSFSLLFFPITLAVHPRIMRAWNEGDAGESVGLIRTALAGQALLYLPVAAGLLLFGRPVLDLLFGAEVAARQVGLLIPLSLAGLAWQVALIAHKPLELRERTRTMLVALVAVWVTNIALNLVLLPVYGVVAVAYSYAGAGLVYAAVTLGVGARAIAPAVQTQRLAVVPDGEPSPSVA